MSDPVSPLLFQPIKLRELTLPNRVVVSPMCMYSARADGLAHEFHLVHYGQYALGGAGLIFTEATAVTPEGRISPDDLGLWNDAQMVQLGHITDFVHRQGSKIGIQLAHAGRKASTYAPWKGKGWVPESEGGWTVLGPDGNAYHELLGTPRSLSVDELQGVVQAFAAAAQRTQMAGFDALEIHAAHGYLLHQFLSPLSNTRTDDYGGSFENRTRLLLEVIRAVHHVWPKHLPLFVRISATDWVEGGWDLEQSIALAKLLAYEGVEVLDVSTGGLSHAQQIEVGPLYQMPFAAHIKAQVPDLQVMTVGMIDTPQQAEGILSAGQADLIALGRPMLRDPHWTQRAARELGLRPTLPDQYSRAGW